MKKWYESKTMWFNIATGVVGFLGIFLEYADAMSIPAEYIFAAATASYFANIYLRTITTTGVEL